MERAEGRLMATMTSTVPLVLATIRDRMAARRDADPDGVLAGVAFTAAPSGDPIPDESIQLFGTDGDQAWGAVGNRRRKETYTISGGIFVQRRTTDEPEVMAKAMRDRAYELLAELEDAARVEPNLGLPYRVIVEVARVNLDQGIEDKGRYAALDIGLGVTAELVSN